ncbi:MAG: hypothetical protein K2X81_15805 [Candidatus Obscuribacterales bacterium]|nr:hypothetical protein [Candidatus Obscuribacterales bacterium]
MNQSIVAAVIFVLVYVVILAGEHSPRKLDRPAAGLIGAVLMVLSGVLSRHDAINAIEFSTIALLLGMMIVIHYANVSGLLELMARKLVGLSRDPLQLLWILGYTSGILSALFVNDTICLLMTPLLLSMLRNSKLPAEPFLICLATSSNVGSAMTITGNPQNMLIGQASGLSWSSFALYLLPVGIVGLALNILIVAMIYRNELKDKKIDNSEPVMIHQFDKKLATKTIVILIGLLIAFLFGVPMDLSAMTAAAIMLVAANRPPAESFEGVDWALLLFFAGLFIVVAGVSKSEIGLLNKYLPAILSDTQSFSGMMQFSGVSILGSNLFGNVPFVMLVRDWVSHGNHAVMAWLLLASTSTFAGNLTLVGSVANLIVAQGAKDECPLSFVSFLKVGVLTTIVTTLLAVGVLFAYQHLHLL